MADLPELRRDPATREWVIISPKREGRPKGFRIPDGDEPLEEFDPECPFCPGNETMTPPEVLAYRSSDSQPDSPGWWVRVVPNKFPVISPDGDLDTKGFGMYDLMHGVGAHEVMIETPKHNLQIATMPLQQLAEVLWAFRDRCLDLSQDTRVRYTMLFRNRGQIAGATLAHPHSQLVALPMIPHDLKQKIAGVAAYYDFHERCLYCDMIRQETNFGERLICGNEEFIAFCPYAPKYPYEIVIMPRGHRRSFVEETRHTIEPMARIVREVMQRLDSALNSPPFNFTFHSAPVNVEKDPLFHWHLSVLPRLTIAAGFEMGTGIYINTVRPEDAARILREEPIEPKLVEAAQPASPGNGETKSASKSKVST
ncbi:MAG: galactose-1-phosphate uridylyltransferase [Fimbriimonadia bacterium]|jgi:UDPglucose--hexose-1-phosphate uridylyltransferase